jgi:hypothetical protein
MIQDKCHKVLQILFEVFDMCTFNEVQGNVRFQCYVSTFGLLYEQ